MSTEQDDLLKELTENIDISALDLSSGSSDPNAKLIEWAETVPEWQSDLCRRLVTKDCLSPEETVQVLNIIKETYSYSIDQLAQTPEPITVEHLPSSVEEGHRIELVSVSQVISSGVMDEDASLEFKQGEGLVVVYGGNGSGKSGFSRVLKASTGSPTGNNSSDIWGNVFEDGFDKTKKASACIEINSIDKVGDTEGCTFHWSDEGEGLPLLSSIRVFDRDVAALYATDEHEITYLPPALNLLQRLAEQQGVLQQVLSETIDWDRNYSDSQVATLPSEEMFKLFPDGVTAQLKNEQIDKILEWDESADKERLKKVASIVQSGNSDLTKISDLKKHASTLSSQAISIETCLSNEAIKVLEEAYIVKNQAQEVARLASEEAFSNRGIYHLEGTGGETWKELFNIARHYMKEEAATDRAFPPVDEEDYCGLCQQELGPEAIKRFVAFEDFVTGEANEKSKIAKERFNELLSPIRLLSWNSELAEVLSKELNKEDGEGVLAASEEMQSLSQELGEVKEKLQSIQELIDNIEEIENFSLLIFPTTYKAKLDNLSKSYNEMEVELKKALEDEELAELEEEYALLSAKQNLQEHKGKIKGIKDKLVGIGALNDAYKALNTKTVSSIKRKIRIDAFDELYEERFKKECEALNVQQSVSVGFRETAGTTKGGVGFSVATEAKKIPMEKILSEGEHRALALAAFLTEVESISGKAAVVLDDPVSSLDHERKSKVAKRLVELAKERQAIVFTHDLSFLFDINREADFRSVPCSAIGVRRSGEKCGVIDQDPTDKVKVTSKLNQLESEVRELEKVYSKGSYEEEIEEITARRIGSNIRDAWEALVERNVLNGVILRFGNAIKTSSLREVSFPDELYKLVNDGMTRTSDWSHDKPMVANPPPPSPEDLIEEINKVREAFNLNKQLQKTNKANRS